MKELTSGGYRLCKLEFPKICNLEPGGVGSELCTIDGLRKELTMTPVNFQSDRLVKSFRLFTETCGDITVPRYFGLCNFGAPDRDSIACGKDIKLNFEGELRDPDQTAPISAFLAAARDPLRMGGIVSLPCGGGKTVVALKIISLLSTKTLIVVHKEFLLNQWRERIRQFLPTASVGLLKADVIDVANHDIVIGSLQSLSMKDYDDALFADFGMLVVDECHRVGTDVFSRALQKTNFRYSLGLSATVERKDGMTKAIIHHIGDVVYSGTRQSESEAAVEVRVVKFSSSDASYAKEEFIMRSSKKTANISRMINNICSFQPRTAQIVDTIRSILSENPGRKVLVLSDRKAQLVDIHAALDPILDVGFFWGGMKEYDLKESESAQVICATFAYAAEGMDIADLDTLVLASPKTDVEQSCGRILRRRNFYNPLIVDIVDTFSQLFIAQSRKRMRFYKGKSYRVD